MFIFYVHRDFGKLRESYKELRKVHKRLESDIRETHLPSEMHLGDSMHRQPEDMIENAEEDEEDERENAQGHERHRENRTPNFNNEEEETALAGNSHSHSLYSRSVRNNHEREVREGPYDFQVRAKEKRDGRKEAKVHRRGNRDGRKR